jgi:hypothetical protein
MSSDKGILNREQEKAFARLIDDAIKAKGLVELFDGYAARAIIVIVDDELIEKLKLAPGLKEKLGNLADAALAENVDDAEVIGAAILNMLVDIPGLDEDAEAVMFEGAVKIIVGAVISALKKKK